MKLAVIADTHLPRGARRLPDECLRRLAAADLILHAGDFCTAVVLKQLEALAPVVGVAGNNDEPDLAAVLPARRIVDVEGVKIGMLHDAGPRSGRHARLLRLFPGCVAVVYAHSHVAELTRKEAVWILNPGSPTERRRSPARSMIEVDVKSRAFRPKVVTLPP